jgi:RNase H-like domain found in reverse transcriptase/Reverse transcriptase (RNA-dependent DNA polymerase)/Integrase zinc binding domain
MVTSLFYVPAFVNSRININTLMDDGCNTYAIISKQAAQRAGLTFFSLPHPIGAASFSDQLAGQITQVAVIDSLDIGGSSPKSSRVFAYVVPKIEGDYEMILGRPWRLSEIAWIDPKTDTLHIDRTGVKICNSALQDAKTYFKSSINLLQISAGSFSFLAKQKGPNRPEVFAVTMADIEKSLKIKKYSDPRGKLLPIYQKFATTLFSRTESDRLPPHRPGIDHKIELEKKDGKDPEIPSGPLYSMSREMLLVLRKTLTELLEKGFIRVSNSPAAAPILFVKKPGGGLRFCVDYRALNAISRKDRYPLPLIRETLSQISRAKWFTKLDVIAAFNKIRIAPGHEWLTAFNTRFGLFEWLVTPFGLTGAPSTFQRFINMTLQEFQDFVSAYIDDILIFTDGSREEHEQKVVKVLQRLEEAGLHLDIDKCEFSVRSTKYLGFIISAEEGIKMDPDKVKAILEWERPGSVKGIRSFLGFANFYRSFIKDYSTIVAPLIALTKLDAQEKKFALTSTALAAFEYLKRAFVTAPILLSYDPDRETVVECDASGMATGGVLMQYDDNGVLRPVAFMSKKMTPAEVNYEIYDKEMLAIIRCVEEWNAQLVSLQQFTIRTDHRNLAYFKEVQKLSERQVRWSQQLSKYNFILEYKPGKLNILADALSRREQDMPKNDDDERIRSRQIQVLKPEQCTGMPRICPVITESTPERDIKSELEQLWEKAQPKDETYQDLLTAVREQLRHLPEKHRHLRLIMADLSVSGPSLLFKSRHWVPQSEPLRTGLLQEVHDSYLTGHPGKNIMTGIMSRTYFWPGMSKDVQMFVRNCRACGRNTVWRTRKQGLLHPLPVPERVWSEISMDFITSLPKTSRGNENILVITDRLSKGPIFIPTKSRSSKEVAKVFITHYMAHHSLPRAIVSDRGEEFVEGIWSWICKLLSIKQRLSTAYHPETDGSTERMNQVLEEYLRHHCTYFQTDWDEWLPIAQIAVSARDATSTGVSPFYMTHGYHANIGSSIQLPEATDRAGPARNPLESARAIVQKIQQCSELAQSTMAYAQQRQQEIANKKRDPTPSYRVGDEVWLDLRNIKVDPLRRRKLAALHDRYTVTDIVGPNACRLNTPGEIFNVFHNTLLRPVRNDPFPSQVLHDARPEPILDEEGEKTWELEEILDVKVEPEKGRRGPLHRWFLCQWTGYAEPTWNHEDYCQDTIALNRFEQKLGRKFAGKPLVRSAPLTAAPKKRGQLAVSVSNGPSQPVTGQSSRKTRGREVLSRS